MKKWTSLILTVLMFLMCLPACFAEATVGVGEGEVVTIWECNWGGDTYEAALQKLAEQATAANIDGKGYKVEATMISWDNFYDTFLTAVIAGTAPDIACEAATGPSLYAEMGEALDLMPIYDAWVAEGNPIATEIAQAGWDVFTLDGKLIGIPFAVQDGGMCYRKDLFEKAGIESLPTTWDEFLDVCAKLKESGVMPLVFVGSPIAGMDNAIGTFMASNDAANISLDLTSNLLNPENQEVYALFDEMYKNGYIPEGILSYTQNDTRRMFLTGEAAMICDGGPTWVTDDLLDVVGALPPFKGPSSDAPYVRTSFQAYHAFDQSGHPDATRAVLKWWMENSDILWTEGNNVTISSRASQAERTLQNDLMIDWAKNWNLNPVCHAGPYPFPTFQTWAGAADGLGVNTWVAEAIFAGDDYLEAAQAADEELNDLLADYR